MTTRAVATDRLGVPRVGPETERSCQVGPEGKVLARTCSLRAGVLAAARNRKPLAHSCRCSPGLERQQSDALEARTKLTSHSALEPGGLPGPAVPLCTSGGTETRAGLNSRLEAVSGA